jgi:RNA polymerase sigma-70 factor (ECF subfamily)
MDNILQNIKSGDITSFRTAYHSYHEKLYFYVMRHTHSPWLAEETVQLTFIKLWENRSRLNADASLSQFIFRIAKSTMIDLLRKEGRRKMQAIPLAEHAPHLTSESPDLSKKDELQRVFETIEQMAPVRKTIFKLSRIDGRSHKEIAEQLSISPKTVENHIGRAIRQLRDTLATLLF